MAGLKQPIAQKGKRRPSSEGEAVDVLETSHSWEEEQREVFHQFFTSSRQVALIFVQGEREPCHVCFFVSGILS